VKTVQLTEEKSKQLETNGKNKNIRDLYLGMNEFKEEGLQT